MNYGHNVLPGLSGALVFSILAAATAALLLTNTLKFAGFKLGTDRHASLHDSDAARTPTNLGVSGVCPSSRDNETSHEFVPSMKGTTTDSPTSRSLILYTDSGSYTARLLSLSDSDMYVLTILAILELFSRYNPFPTRRKKQQQSQKSAKKPALNGRAPVLKKHIHRSSSYNVLRGDRDGLSKSKRNVVLKKPVVPSHDMRGVVFPKCASADQAMQGLRSASFTYRSTSAGGYWRTQRMRHAECTVDEEPDHSMDSTVGSTSESSSGSTSLDSSEASEQSCEPSVPVVDDSTKPLPTANPPLPEGEGLGGWTTVTRQRRARNAKHAGWPYGNDHTNKRKTPESKSSYYKDDAQPPSRPTKKKYLTWN